MIAFGLTTAPALAQSDLWIRYQPGSPCQVISGEKPLVHSLASQYYPVWIDAEHVALTSNRDGDWEIYLYGTRNKSIKRITHAPGWDYWATPDHHGGIVFVSERSGYHEIWRRSKDGKLKQLTHWKAYTTHPFVMPNGDILVSSNFKNPGSRASVIADGRFDLYRLDSQGHLKQALTQGTGDKTSPVLLPDGHIAYANNKSGRLEIWLLEGLRHSRAFALPEGDLYAPSVQPDGTLWASAHFCKHQDRRLSTREYRYVVRLDPSKRCITPLTDPQKFDATTRGY